MAPQTDEFGTKVGLLAGLVLVSAARPIIERFVPEPRTDADDLRRFGRRLLDGGNAAAGGAVRAARAGVAAVLVLALGAGIVAAGAPARGFVVADSSEVLNRLPQQVDPATIPAVTVGQDVVDFDPTLAGDGINDVVVTLAQNLELENQALLRRDPTILPAVDHGDRLTEMQARLADAVDIGNDRGRALPVRHLERPPADPVRRPGWLQPGAGRQAARCSGRRTTLKATCSSPRSSTSRTRSRCAARRAIAG